jgi:hypothetical protein
MAAAKAHPRAVHFAKAMRFVYAGRANVGRQVMAMKKQSNSGPLVIPYRCVCRYFRRSARAEYYRVPNHLR